MGRKACTQFPQQQKQSLLAFNKLVGPGFCLRFWLAKAVQCIIIIFAWRLELEDSLIHQAGFNIKPRQPFACAGEDLTLVEPITRAVCVQSGR